MAITGVAPLYSGYSGPPANSPPAWTQTSVFPAGLGSDSIGPSGSAQEGVAVPLLSNMAPNDATYAAKHPDTHLDGMKAIALLGAVISGLAVVLVPLLMEIRETRGKTKAELQRENFVHIITNASRATKDPSVEWVHSLEATGKENIDAVVSEGLARLMLDAWGTARSAPADSAQYQQAKTLLSQLQAPVKEVGGKLVLEEGMIHPVEVLAPSAGTAITHLYTNYLAQLKQRNAMDGDNGRLVQMQAQHYLDSVSGVGNRAGFLQEGQRLAARSVDYIQKLQKLHALAKQHFINWVVA